MKKVFLSLFTLAAFVFSAATSRAQIHTPAPSPGAKLEQTVGLTTVTVEYSRPGVKDRVIFADDGLVPFGKVWRTGANSATKITFSDDVKLQGKEVKKGAYAMLTIPGATEWTINLYEYDSGSWNSYTKKEPTVSLTAKPEALPFSLESLTFDINDLRDASATINIVWDKTVVSMNLEVEVESKVMAAIEKTMSGPGQGDYYAAAQYYYNNGKDLKQAYVWAHKANEMDAKFWQLRLESQILGDMKKYPEAIATAKKSKAAAIKAENEDYVRLNDKSIAEWRKMMGNKSSLKPAVKSSEKE